MACSFAARFRRAASRPLLPRSADWSATAELLATPRACAPTRHRQAACTRTTAANASFVRAVADRPRARLWSAVAAFARRASSAARSAARRRFASARAAFSSRACASRAFSSRSWASRSASAARWRSAKRSLAEAGLAGGAVSIARGGTASTASFSTTGADAAWRLRRPPDTRGPPPGGAAGAPVGGPARSRSFAAPCALTRSSSLRSRPCVRTKFSKVSWLRNLSTVAASRTNTDSPSPRVGS